MSKDKLGSILSAEETLLISKVSIRCKDDSDRFLLEELKPGKAALKLLKKVALESPVTKNVNIRMAKTSEDCTLYGKSFQGTISRRVSMHFHPTSFI